MKYLQIISLVIQIAKMVEAAVPLGGQGKAKLAFAVDAAAAIYETEEDIRQSWKDDKDAFLNAITRASGAVVGLLNAAGIFKKSK
ncbi:MAG: hypothetical protein M1436_05225 [Acidobacteria bacterium]|nr:hypothetical protein [Acidobacteriota bacterium]